MISITSLGQMAPADYSLAPVTTDYSRFLVTQNKLVEPAPTTALEPAPQPATAQPVIGHAELLAVEVVDGDDLHGFSFGKVSSKCSC